MAKFGAGESISAKVYIPTIIIIVLGIFIFRNQIKSMFGG